jgi:hypothetical protein
MAVELDGNVRMRGDTGPGARVRVLAENGRLRLVSGNELVGDWLLSEIGVSALQDGFTIKAEGEEFILRTGDDVAFAEELGVTAVSPRLGRLLAARNNPEEPEVAVGAPEGGSNLPAIGFAVAGSLTVLGGTLLSAVPDRGRWIGFIVGGVLMVAVGYVMSIGASVARLIGAIVLIAMVVLFGIAVSQSPSGTAQLTAYGFIAGGLVVGVAVLFSGNQGSTT